MVTPFIETVILKDSVDDYRAEDITRHVAVARCPASMKEYQKGVVPGQVSRCMKIGRAIREAKKKRKDVKASNAIQVFQGKVTSFTMEGKGGFNWCDWIIEGSGKYSGHKLRIWYKNENLLSWLDDEPYILCPDLVTGIDEDGFEGASNFARDKTHEGKNIIVYGIKAHENWKKPEGLEIFTPKHFGIDLEYVSFEKARI